MRPTSSQPIKKSTQLHLFEQTSPEVKKWSAKDIWSSEWNLAIDLAIIMACTGKWIQLKDMAALAEEFAIPSENLPAFSYQVKHLEMTEKLRERTNAKSNTSEWIAV